MIYDFASNTFISENGKVYAVCLHCHTLVRLNKPIVGSMHLCNQETK